MMRAARSQSGFTLIEMLLAMAVFAMVMAGVYSALRVGMNARRQNQAQTLQTARAALDALSSHMQTCFTVPNSNSYSMDGAESEISFFTFPHKSTQPVKVSYFLGDGKSCDGLCRTVNRDPFDPDAAAPLPEPVAPGISTLQFSYFDGVEWTPAWTAPGILPERVRIAVDVAVSGEPQRFETEANLPGSGIMASIPAPAE